MKRLTALELSERLRQDDVSVVCAIRRRGVSGDDVVRRLDAAATRVSLELFTVDAGDPGTVVLLDQLGVQVLPCVFIVAGGVLVERLSVVRDAVDARRLMAQAILLAPRPSAAVQATQTPQSMAPQSLAPKSAAPQSTAPAASALTTKPSQDLT